ncbi:hypothetical protein TNCV_2224271 [Trichonephila clavipes]|nr:hypothetical protein TNCV_2224271 [Trichonephila clavipes]
MWSLMGERRISDRADMEFINDDRRAVQPILTDELQMRNICVKYVPKVLTDEQKQVAMTCVRVTFKSCLKGTHFTSIADVQGKMVNHLKGLPKSSFQNYYHQWKYRMQKCVNAEGDYFEGYNVTKN